MAQVAAKVVYSPRSKGKAFAIQPKDEIAGCFGIALAIQDDLQQNEGHTFGAVGDVFRHVGGLRLLCSCGSFYAPLPLRCPFSATELNLGYFLNLSRIRGLLACRLGWRAAQLPHSRSAPIRNDGVA